MEVDITQQRRRDSQAEKRESNEMIMRIRKLRWIGMEEEANRVQVTLGSSSSVDCVLAGPSDTD